MKSVMWDECVHRGSVAHGASTTGCFCVVLVMKLLGGSVEDSGSLLDFSKLV
jgi:hypothetical protein